MGVSDDFARGCRHSHPSEVTKNIGLQQQEEIARSNNNSCFVFSTPKKWVGGGANLLSVRDAHEKASQ